MNESEQTSFMAMQSLTTINHVDAWQHISMWDDASAIDYPPSKTDVDSRAFKSYIFLRKKNNTTRKTYSNNQHEMEIDQPLDTISRCDSFIKNKLLPLRLYQLVKFQNLSPWFQLSQTSKLYDPLLEPISGVQHV